jgi:ATPase subunit of ABC transporter with duplicated ATPase domains
MLVLQNISYAHPNRDVLFQNIQLTINTHDKAALIGNNGTGKSTLLNILAGVWQPSAGQVKALAKPYYIPQLLGQYNQCTVAQALQVADTLQALKEILNGQVTEANLAMLNDDWAIEERCHEALQHWQLTGISLQQPMASLSGGEKTKVFLAGIAIHQPRLVLMDEPSNHLDAPGREMLYDYIRTTANTLVVVSHDRTLLNLLPLVYELSKQGITTYGGNYDFYVQQKAIEANALEEDVKSREKALRKAKETERESLERQQKLDARGKKKQEKAGLPTISMNTFRNNAEKSTARLKDVHAKKVDAISDELNQLRAALPGIDKMKIGFDDATLHAKKILVKATGINYSYGHAPQPPTAFRTNLLWQQPLNITITGGQRIAIKGANGSGKTTLIKMILGELQPTVGDIYRAICQPVYIDQDYSVINNAYTVYEQVQRFNTGHLQEHEVKSRLTHFLFTKNYWDKSCGSLSGGEKMRLLLCCLTMGRQAPDIIILDEPTNNLDIQNIEILTAAINEYRGTVIVVSHDQYFLEQVQVQETIVLD